MEETLEQSPFPRLTWEDYFWVGEITLPSWAGFQVSHGEGRATDAVTRSDGSARLAISSIDSTARAHPIAEQITAFRHLLDHEAAVAKAVARALVRYCPGEAYDGDDDVLWEIDEVDDLRRLVRLTGAHVLDVVHDGLACIGFEFECAWDPEHGAGVMTHQGRVIATGQVDCSFTERIAQQGLDRK